MKTLSQVALVAAFFVSATAADAQAMKCGTRAQLHSALEEGFGEKRKWAGTSGQGRVMELFVSPDEQAWTLILSGPDGVSCPVGSGGAWREFDTEPQTEDEGA